VTGDADIAGSAPGAQQSITPRQSGLAHVVGTWRIEDPVQRTLVVAILNIAYGYEPDLTPAFDRWPSGSYEAGIFDQGQSGLPVTIGLDGFGRASFEYRDRMCDVDLTNVQLGNPCAGT
jgi:hypothetical protein